MILFAFFTAEEHNGSGLRLRTLFFCCGVPSLCVTLWFHELKIKDIPNKDTVFQLGGGELSSPPEACVSYLTLPVTTHES